MLQDTTKEQRYEVYYRDELKYAFKANPNQIELVSIKEDTFYYLPSEPMKIHSLPLKELAVKDKDSSPKNIFELGEVHQFVPKGKRVLPRRL